jgi:hypothetical protein
MAVMTSLTMTPNEAARETRKRIRAKIRRLKANTFLDREAALDELMKFVNGMDERQDKKEGGLGVMKK